ncbi:MAG: hypothetical protein ACXVZO_06705 [Gaiellaceae bacterium]
MSTGASPLALDSRAALRAAKSIPQRFARGRGLILAAWTASRLVVFACAALAQALRLPPLPAHVRLGASSQHPFALLGVWDGRWYQQIAAHGYLLIPGRQSNPAFFPLLPILLHAAGAAGIPGSVAGLLIANGAFLVALLGFYELSRALLPEPDAHRATLYLAIFPFGFVFSMVYPESITLAAFVFAGLFAIRGRWLACAACASLATLARPEGALLALPLLSIAWRFRGRGRLEWARSLAASLAGPATLVAITTYFWLSLGDPFAWQKAERVWGRSFEPSGLYHAFHELKVAIVLHHQNLWLFRDVGFCLLYALLLVVALRGGLPRSWILAGAMIVLLPLASGSFASDARFGLLALPAFWALALLGRNDRIHRLILTLSPALLGACVISTVFRWP